MLGAWARAVQLRHRQESRSLCHNLLATLTTDAKKVYINLFDTPVTFVSKPSQCQDFKHLYDHLNAVPASASFGATHATRVPFLMSAMILLLQVSEPLNTSFCPIVKMLFSWYSAKSVFSELMYADGFSARPAHRKSKCQTQSEELVC